MKFLAPNIMKSSNFLVFLQLSYDIETFFDMFQAFEHIWV